MATDKLSIKLVSALLAAGAAAAAAAASTTTTTATTTINQQQQQQTWQLWQRQQHHQQNQQQNQPQLQQQEERKHHSCFDNSKQTHRVCIIQWMSLNAIIVYDWWWVLNPSPMFNICYDRRSARSPWQLWAHSSSESRIETNQRRPWRGSQTLEHVSVVT